MKAEVGEGFDTAVGDEEDAASFPSPAAVRAAAGDVLFTPEAQASVPAAAGRERHFYLIDKHAN
jgi:hypothetical protein